MGQLGPPHRGGMLPPGQQVMNPGQQTPTPSYQNLAGRPPSRTSTPQGMMNPSPSMAPRQPMVPGGSDPINNELATIQPHVLNMIKNELSLGDKNMHTLTIQDKVRLLQTSLFRLVANFPFAASYFTSAPGAYSETRPTGIEQRCCRPVDASSSTATE